MTGLGALVGLGEALRSTAAEKEAQAALGAAQNARGMVLNRDIRFLDLVALVSQQGNLLTELSDRLAANIAEDDTEALALHAELVRLGGALDVAVAGLSATDQALADRMAAAERSLAANATADAALAVRVAALENAMPAVTSGRASRTNLLMAANATVDVAVVFDAPAPDLTYAPVPILDAPTLAGFEIVGYPTKTLTGVTVRIRSKVLISVAITLSVTVLALKL